MPSKLFQTNISQAYWRTLGNEEKPFAPAILSLTETGGEETISWFDKLFEGGLLLPEVPGSPLTVLLAGPPGSGKTTLALELCYRLAANTDGLFSLYISTDQETERLIENAKSYGYKQAERYIVDFGISGEANKYDVNRVAIWGKDSITTNKREKDSSPKPPIVQEKSSMMSDIVDAALHGLNGLLLRNAIPRDILGRLRDRLLRKQSPSESERAYPDILVIDSLNIVAEDQRDYFFEQFQIATSSGSRMVIFVLDSGAETDTHRIWEYACDVIIRMDHTYVNDYYLRTIEVVKARYQSHIWGKHQLKIYKQPSLPRMPLANAPGHIWWDYNEKLRRAHPYRMEGGIFIYPSIGCPLKAGHYYTTMVSGL